MEDTEEKINCKTLPNLVSSFIDTFVDFCITGDISSPPDSSSAPLQTRITSPVRLIAIGDLHGDLSKSKQSLQLAGLIDAHEHWSGGASTLVQVGDVLDRGGQELKILYFLERLKKQAIASGGNVITMNGNHEIMNVDGDFRYVTPAGFDEFKHWAYWFCVGNSMKQICKGLVRPRDIYEGVPKTFPGVKPEYYQGFRARLAALRPKGPIATRFLSENLTVVVIGENVFVHGGMLPKHVVYGLDKINNEVRDWISGVKERVSSSLVRGRNSLVWLRIFSNEVAKDCDCGTLEHVLSTIPGARRMIMGHTIQEGGINGVCDNRAVRIDVGMSKGCINGLPEVLEISDEFGVRILTSKPNAKSMHRYQRVDLLPVPVPRQVQVEA